MTYIPLNGNVIVERVAPVKISSGGIILQSSQEPDKAKVIATGSDAVQIGDLLLINWNKCAKIGEDTFRIHIDDCIAVFTE
jgi:co-chaperonin GroES (HSP10)